MTIFVLSIKITIVKHYTIEIGGHKQIYRGITQYFLNVCTHYT